MKYVIDAARAGEALSEYQRRWAYQLRDMVDGAVLDFSHDREVDALCKRISVLLTTDLSKEARDVKALLSARINFWLANALNEPEAEVLPARSERPTDEEILRDVFGKLLSKLRLPDSWNGLKYTR